jgi:hypothetical protein
MANFGTGSKFEAGTLQGYASLQRRLAALKSPTIGSGIMRSLANQANREEKALMYSQVTRRTGNSGRNVTIGEVTPTQAALIARSTAVFIDRGTRPHIIRPKNKRILAWPSSGAGRRLTGSARRAMFTPGGSARLGGWSYAMVVHHPGTRPHEFMIAGARLAVSKSGLGNAVVDAWNAAA